MGVKKSNKTSDKSIARMLAELSAMKGIRHVVISSGSRNAPLAIAFDAQTGIESLCIIDERSAAFFALGIAQQTNKPVGLICTSGSAVLNYAPAISEAFYQKIPLVVITADRPHEWVDQDDGQTIRQQSIYANYCKASFNLPVETVHPDEFWYVQRTVSEAFNRAAEPGNEGPVHINVPFREPLYKEVEKGKAGYRTIDIPRTVRQLDKEDEKKLLSAWNNAQKKIIICGLHKPDKELNKLLARLADNSSVAVFTETTSNMQSGKFIGNVDAVVDSFNEGDKIVFQPELLITLGGPVTSKKLKMYLRKYRPHQHWHISPAAEHIDTYQSLTNVLTVDEKYFIDLLSRHHSKGKNKYHSNLASISRRGYKTLRIYCKKTPFSDFKVMDIILDNIPRNSDLHLGNSTPIRYANLFETDAKNNIKYFCNRGVSGIDGVTSTATGAACSTKRIVTLITGDVGFFYDSNALWSKHLSSNLRIIVINNRGGGIFRLIDSKDTPLLEKYFEAKHNMSAEGLARAHNIPYYAAQNENELEQNMDKLYKEHKSKPAILEVFTPNELNAEIWSGYFKSLKNED